IRIHQIICYMNGHLFAKMMIIFIGTNLPINILFINMIYFSHLNIHVLKLMVLAIMAHAFSALLVFIPVSHVPKAFHKCSKYLITLQIVLGKDHLFAKQKLLHLYERVYSHRIIGFSVGPLSVVTNKLLAE